MVDQTSHPGLGPDPAELVPPGRAPDTLAGWKALAESLLTNQFCVFHRNAEITACYAWLYQVLPSSLKWAGMAAFASHHVRLALVPLRLDADRTGLVDLANSLARRRVLLTADVDTIRATNNAIFDDVFWVHLAYGSSADGIERLRVLLHGHHHYAPVLAAFEAIDRGRRVLEDPGASAQDRRRADDLVWQGNVAILEHEQRALVQPRFDRLSCASARLLSMGSATTFEVRGLRHELSYFTSFYGYSFTRGMPHVLRARAWPRMTRLDDRWSWVVTDVVPRFRRFAADERLIGGSLRRICDEARAYASTPCVVPQTRRPARDVPAG